MRLAVPLLLLLVAGDAAALSYEDPVFEPVTLHAQFADTSGALTRDPTPEGWRLQNDQVCRGTDERRFVPSTGAPLTEGDEVVVRDGLGLFAPLRIDAASELDWRIEVPRGLTVSATVTATAGPWDGDPWLQARQEVVLEPDGPTHVGSLDAVDVHRVVLPLEAEDAVRLERASSVTVSVDSIGCLARHHSSPEHRPVWNVLAGTPLQAHSLEYRDGRFVAWVGSVWGPDDVVLGDLHVRLPGGNATLPLTEFFVGTPCHCGDDGYQFIARWEAPEPSGDWMAETEVASRSHPDTLALRGGEGDPQAPEEQAPVPALLPLAAVVVALLRRR